MIIGILIYITCLLFNIDISKILTKRKLQKIKNTKSKQWESL